MLGLKGIFKSLQSKRRHGKHYKTMQGHSCDTILGEKGRVSGDVIWGKRTKRKKKYGRGRILHQMFHFRGSNCRRTEAPGGRSAVPTSGGLLPRSAARVRAGSQIPTNPDPSPVPASLSCSDHSLVQTPLSCFFISSIRLKHHLDYIFTEKSPMLPPAQKRPSFSLISHPWLRSALETDHLLP